MSLQSQTTTPTATSHYPSSTSENEHKLSNIKSPHKSTFIKKRPTKSSQNNENVEPNHSKSVSFPEPINSTNHGENRNVSVTPVLAKQDIPIPDAIAAPREHIREHNMTTKPGESPFTAFCKGLHLSPGPLPNVSPGMFGKHGLFGNNEVGNFISPSPLNLHLGPENGSSSPLFPRKHITKLDFSNRLIMFKSNRDEISIEPEDVNSGAPFEPNLSYEEITSSSPKFSFPMKKSIYSNTNLVATQSRTNDIYSTSPPGKSLHHDESEDKEEDDNSHIQTANLNQDGNDLDNTQLIQTNGNVMVDDLKTPSPRRRVTLDAINSFPGKNENQQKVPQTMDNLSTQRVISFGTANAANDADSARSSVAKGKIEEEEEGDTEDMNAKGLSTSKKKICCNCKKSRCLKLYCDCFARGKGCTKECNCQNCLNNEDNAEERKSAMMCTLERNPIAFKPKVTDDTVEKIEIKETLKARHIKGCNCKKSGCLKKYCECYQAGAKCTDVCKCENCKNMDPVTSMRRSQPYGGYSNTAGSETNKLESPLSEIEGSTVKINTRNIQTADQDENDEENSPYEGSDGEDMKKYINPRKQLFTNTKGPVVAQNGGEKTDAPGEHAEEKNAPDKHKSGNKPRERRRKGSANLMAPPKTPTFSEQKKNFEYTPSPEKQSLSGGRTRRNVRPFSHMNPDEYEFGK